MVSRGEGGGVFFPNVCEATFVVVISAFEIALYHTNVVLWKCLCFRCNCCLVDNGFLFASPAEGALAVVSAIAGCADFFCVFL